MATRNALIVFLFTLAVMAETALSQECIKNGGCPGIKECCSRSGFCGTKDAYCGFWCFSGPCKLKPKPSGYVGLNAGPRATIESVITPTLFNSIMSKVASNCSAKGFYTHKALINALKPFGAYKGKVAKREMAAILAQFSYGSQNFCNKEERVRGKYCSASKEYPCEPGKDYYGRGPLLTKWNEYYGAAGDSLGLSLLKDPDMVARSPEVAFKFAMWFWNKNVRPAISLGFGATTRRINGLECDGWNRGEVKSRVIKYLEFCKLIGVTPGANLNC